jgi:DNA polymerase III alpha subunit
MTDLNGRVVQEDGSVVNTKSILLEMLYNGRDIGQCLIDDPHEVERFRIANKLCDTDLPSPIYNTELLYSGMEWRKYWFTPDEYRNIDLTSWCLEKCQNQEEIDRVKFEISEFEKRDMVPAIIHMIYCVDTWRKNNILWGVGRGSSVSSFVLYLIGINRLNPLKYNLELKEWLK